MDDAAFLRGSVTPLESGKGNVSLLVLRQIAAALGTALDALVGGGFEGTLSS